MLVVLLLFIENEQLSDQSEILAFAFNRLDRFYGKLETDQLP